MTTPTTRRPHRQHQPAGTPTTGPSWRATALLLGGLALAATLLLALALSGEPSTPGGHAPDTIRTVLTAPVVPARPVADLSRLPLSTTFTTTPTAPRDTTRSRPPSGLVVHPRTPVPVFAAPGGRAIAALPTRQINSPTWLAVIATEPGWVQVLLPSRPNAATGWLSTTDSKLDTAHSPYRITVDRARFTLTLHHHGNRVGRWRVGIGTPDSETPAGRTFLLASVDDRDQGYSPVILPLGTHSSTYDTYGGGPGTTGIHGWPDPAVFGRRTSDGCVRVPADALSRLTDVPLGTPVLIH